MKISEIIKDKYKLRIPPTVYYDLLADVQEVEESTTNNDLGVDCISRAQTQAEIEMNALRYTIAKERGGMGQVEWSDQLIKVSDAVDIIRHLPSVTPQDPQSFKWCTDCKEYDQEKHCCHRWSKVIRDAVVEMKQEQEPRWIPVSERLPDTDNEVLCWYEYYHWSEEKILPEYGIGQYIDDKWYGEVGVGRDVRTIAWMPLPKPYEPQESEGQGMTEQTIKDIDRAFKALEERDELLDKITAEINELYSYYEFDEDSKTSFNMVRLEEVQGVIDKYQGRK